MTPAGKAHILDLIWDDAGLLVSLDLTGTRCGDTCRWYDDDNTTRATFRSDIMRPWGKQHFNIISFLFWLVILLCSFTVPLVCWNLSFSWPVGVSSFDDSSSSSRWDDVFTIPKILRYLQFAHNCLCKTDHRNARTPICFDTCTVASSATL
jgi:hypothetical protein